MNYIITTPLYYVNDKPHLGSVYTTLICDSIARYNRLIGNKVVFVTGVDEHGLKIQRTSSQRGISPEKHCDEISSIFYKSWEKWNISFSKFIRTSSDHHKKIVQEFYNKVKNNGDIYMGTQKGWYCVGCEEFKDNPSDSPQTTCPIHKKPLEWKNEENLFFKLSKYQKQIEEIINNENFIYPKERRNEIKSFVKKGLKDFSISRTNLSWGIKVPDKDDHTFYVWFDALLGYVSALSIDEEPKNLDCSIKLGWPATLHLIGKDILRFHAIYWPAMLLSAGMATPKKIIGHGFLTREGQKMGKSLGNVLDPDILLEKYGEDAVRWFLLKDIILGNDGDFQHVRFVDIVNNDLANTIGNLLNRTVSMSRKWFNNSVPDLNEQNSKLLEDLARKNVNDYLEYFNNNKIDLASNLVLNYAIKINLYLNENEPWVLIKDDSNSNQVKKIIYNVLESTRIIGLLMYPLLPNLSIRINSQLGNLYTEEMSWKEQLQWGILPLSKELPKPKPIIEKLEYE